MDFDDGRDGGALGVARGVLNRAAEGRGDALRLQQRASGMRGAHAHHVLGSADADDGAAGMAAFRAQIDDPVGGADDVEIVFDHQQRVPGLDEAPERTQQLGDVVEMQAGGGLIEKKQRTARRSGGPRRGRTASAARAMLARRILGEVTGEFETLRFAAGQGRYRLAQPQVFQPHLRKRRQTQADLRVRGEERQRFRDRQIEHIGDALRREGAARELHLEHLGTEAPPVAIRTAQIHIREKLHLDMLEAVAAARGAAAVAGIETEGAGRIAIRLC